MLSLYEPDALVVESVRFPAGRHRLEGELVYPETSLPRGAAVLAGPHPLLGSNMHDTVIRGLGDGLARHGLVTLRFNYHTVGASEVPPADLDEDSYQEDLAGAVAFLRSVVGGDAPLALIGYDFGCTLLPALVRAVGAAAPLVLIAPAVGMYDDGAFAAIENPKLVIAPEGDSAADAERLARWFGDLPAPKELLRPRLDSHFFRGHEHWLLATVGTFLNGEWR